MEQYLIDTNVVSDYFTASFPVGGLMLMDSVFDSVPNISVITQIELLCWKTNSLSELKVREFIADSVVIEINPDVVSLCVNIRRGKKIKTPDAIIAATALAYDLTLITNNEKDFSNINGLKIVNPYKV